MTRLPSHLSILIILLVILSTSSCRMAASTPVPGVSNWKTPIPFKVTPTPMGEFDRSVGPNPSLPSNPMDYQLVENTPIEIDSRQKSDCDLTTSIQDVTIPDGSIMQPGELFIKRWRLLNSGDCAWEQSYRLVLVGGDPLGASNLIQPHFVDPSDSYSLRSPQWTKLEKQVLPGEEADLIAVFAAPYKAGEYTGYWQLINTAGDLVEHVFWVSIVVEDEHPLAQQHWPGGWKILDPYSWQATITNAHFFQTEDQVEALFYDHTGEMILVKGWSEDSDVINGEFGSPWQDIQASLRWKLTSDKKQFQSLSQTAKPISLFTCGYRDTLNLPEPCVIVLE